MTDMKVTHKPIHVHSDRRANEQQIEDNAAQADNKILSSQSRSWLTTSLKH